MMMLASRRAPEILAAGSMVDPAQLYNVGLCMHKLEPKSQVNHLTSQGADLKLISALHSSTASQ